MSIKNPQLPSVNCYYGATMGRREYTEGLDTPSRCFRLNFVDGCYDEGGAYWGLPANVYCAMNDEGLQLFCRASSRNEAKELFNERHPQLKWLR